MQKALISALFEELVPYKEQTEEAELEYEQVIKKSMAEYPNDSEIIKNLI